MTNQPDDPIDAGGGVPRRSGTGRLAWLFAGAAALAGLAIVAVLANSWRGPNVDASPSAPVVSIVACTAGGLAATVGHWEGAAGHRIGTLTVTNTGTGACGLPSAITPSLIDRNGHDLIVGKAASLQPVTIPVGGSLDTLVQTGNYCGPTAQEPAAIVLAFGSQRLVAGPVAGDDSSGVPPCMGEAGPTDDITIQNWGAAQG